jgi:hypothetical protein
MPGSGGAESAQDRRQIVLERLLMSVEHVAQRDAIVPAQNLSLGEAVERCGETDRCAIDRLCGLLGCEPACMRVPLDDNSPPRALVGERILDWPSP